MTQPTKPAPFMILWGAIMMSQPLFVLVGYIIKQDPSFLPSSEYEVLLLPFSLVAILLAGAALFGIDRFFPLAKGAKMPQAFTIRLILKLSLSESIGLLGLVLFFLGAPWEVLLIFTGLSVLLMLNFAPTNNRVQDFARELAQKS